MESSPRSSGSQMAKEVRENFLVPTESSLKFSRISTLAETLPSELSRLAGTFHHNLTVVVDTAGVPLTLASSTAQGSHWQRIHTAERIRARMLEPEEGEEESSLESRREAHAHAQAAEKMREFSSSPDGQSAMVDDTCAFLLRSLQSPEFSSAARELLSQAVVLTWSALEVLAHDLFEEILNQHPKKVLDLVSEPSLKHRFEFKLSLNELADYDFNISSSVGSLLAAQRDFSDIRIIKAALPPLLTTQAQVVEALSQRSLWILCQKRYLIVHRRGIVDSRYLEATGEDLKLGSRLQVDPATLKHHIQDVVAAGATLLEGAA